MNMITRKNLYVGIGLILSFLLWTIAIQHVDVQPIGPHGSMVGFGSLNQFVLDITGVHFILYNITDWLGIVPIVCMFGFAVFGLLQWITRKHILYVDFSILALGLFYFVVTAVYVFFEIFVVNYRPVLINGVLEASYPSSTTMLVMTVMPTAIIQFNCRIKNKVLRRFVAVVISVFIILMVLGRLVSGVHWFTDIIGGILLSSGLVLVYREIICLEVKKSN